MKSAQAWQKTTVIVVNYNTADLTVACIRSIPETIPVILVDNASVDNSANRVRNEFCSRESPLVIIENEFNLGFPKANNQAIDYVTTEYVFLLNSDTLLKTNEIEALTMWLDDHPEFAACGPRLVYPDGTPQHSPSPIPTPWMYAVRFLGIKHFFPRKKLRYITARLGPFLGDSINSYLNSGAHFTDTSNQDPSYEYISGAAFLVRRSVIEEVGKLDEGYFMYLEDVDWCIRIKRAGWKIGFVDAVEILHYAGASFKDKKYKKTYRAVSPESYKSIMRYLHTYFGVFGRSVVMASVSISLIFQMLSMGIFFFIKGEGGGLVKTLFSNLMTIWTYRFERKS